METRQKMAGGTLIGLAILLGILLAYPVRTGAYRAGILLCAAGICTLLIGFCWRKRVLRRVLAAVPVLAMLALVLPGRPVDRTALRDSYMHHLARFQGTQYVWGGETALGVDCSGLLRTALVDAQFSEGLRTLNPGLLRAGLSLWWHDGSANAMNNGYAGRTRRVGALGSLKSVGEGGQLQAGDFAVTADGTHVLAYAGDGQWIEADPFVNRVICLRNGVRSPWWTVEVVASRWRCLE